MPSESRLYYKKQKLKSEVKNKMIQITGYKPVTRDFTNDKGEIVHYDGYIFYFVTDEDKNVRGLSTELYGTKNLSVSVKNLHDITGCEGPDDVVNRKYRAPTFYQSYGRLKLAPLEPIKDSKAS